MFNANETMAILNASPISVVKILNSGGLGIGNLGKSKFYFYDLEYFKFDYLYPNGI